MTTGMTPISTSSRHPIAESPLARRSGSVANVWYCRNNGPSAEKVPIRILTLSRHGRLIRQGWPRDLIVAGVRAMVTAKAPEKIGDVNYFDKGPRASSRSQAVNKTNMDLRTAPQPCPTVQQPIG